MGVDWNSEEMVIRLATLIDKMKLVYLGMYCWECFVTFGFDWQVITGKRKFKWPMVVYWVSKYSVLGFVIGINVFAQTTTRIACNVLQVWLNIFFVLSMATASGLFVLRTIALWRRNRYVMWGLGVLCLGQWGLFLYNATILGVGWSDDIGTCLVETSDITTYKAMFCYNMIFDGIVFILSLYALRQLPGVSSIWKLLFKDGLVYFAISFLCYLAAAIMTTIDPSPILSFILADPASILASVAANRAFVRLSNFGGDGGTQNSKSGNGLTSLSVRPGATTKRSQAMPTSDNGVRVQMETFTSVVYPETTIDDQYRSKVDMYDAESKEDLESQHGR